MAVFLASVRTKTGHHPLLRKHWLHKRVSLGEPASELPNLTVQKENYQQHTVHFASQSSPLKKKKKKESNELKLNVSSKVLSHTFSHSKLKTKISLGQEAAKYPERDCTNFPRKSALPPALLTQSCAEPRAGSEPKQVPKENHTNNDHASTSFRLLPPPGGGKKSRLSPCNTHKSDHVREKERRPQVLAQNWLWVQMISLSQTLPPFKAQHRERGSPLHLGLRLAACCW